MFRTKGDLPADAGRSAAQDGVTPWQRGREHRARIAWEIARKSIKVAETVLCGQERASREPREAQGTAFLLANHTRSFLTGRPLAFRQSGRAKTFRLEAVQGFRFWGWRNGHALGRKRGSLSAACGGMGKFRLAGWLAIAATEQASYAYVTYLLLRIDSNNILLSLYSCGLAQKAERISRHPQHPKKRNNPAPVDRQGPFPLDPPFFYPRFRCRKAFARR
jgi:hypothetical protein